MITFSASIFVWNDGYFLTALISFPSFLLMYVASSAHAFLTEGKQKRMIKGAFAQYLAPDMVDALIADPEKLQLGGEKRVMRKRRLHDATNTISWHQVLVSPRLILDLQGKTWFCGLCAARPAPHIVKHERLPHKRALTELGKHTHSRS